MNNPRFAIIVLVAIGVLLVVLRGSVIRNVFRSVGRTLSSYGSQASGHYQKHWRPALRRRQPFLSPRAWSEKLRRAARDVHNVPESSMTDHFTRSPFAAMAFALWLEARGSLIIRLALRQLQERPEKEGYPITLVSLYRPGFKETDLH